MAAVTSTLRRHLTILLFGGGYAIASLIGAGALVAILPERFTTAILVGWILAVIVVARFIRARYLPGRR